MNKIKAIAFATVAYTVFPALNIIGVLLDCQWGQFFWGINQDIKKQWKGEDSFNN